MAIEKVEVLNIAECVCKRPKMFTATGSIEEIVAFFSGYESASMYSSNVKDMSPVQALSWISSECGIEDRFSYGLPLNYVEVVKNRFGTSSNLLEELLSYFSSLKHSST